MKKMAILMGAMVVAGAVNAGEGVYVGAKTGLMLFDDSAVDDPPGYGAVLGYEFGRGFSAEYEGNYAEPDFENKAFKSDFDYYTNAIYGVWRSEGDEYFKAKLGYSHQNIESDLYDLDESETDVSYGIGVGAKLAKNWMLELEYTVIGAKEDDELDELDESYVKYVNFSIGYHF